MRQTVHLATSSRRHLTAQKSRYEAKYHIIRRMQIARTTNEAKLVRFVHGHKIVPGWDKMNLQFLMAAAYSGA